MHKSKSPNNQPQVKTQVNTSISIHDPHYDYTVSHSIIELVIDEHRDVYWVDRTNTSVNPEHHKISDSSELDYIASECKAICCERILDSCKLATAHNCETLLEYLYQVYHYNWITISKKLILRGTYIIDDESVRYKPIESIHNKGKTLAPYEITPLLEVSSKLEIIALLDYKELQSVIENNVGLDIESYFNLSTDKLKYIVGLGENGGIQVQRVGDSFSKFKGATKAAYVISLHGFTNRERFSGMTMESLGNIIKRLGYPAQYAVYPLKTLNHMNEFTRLRTFFDEVSLKCRECRGRDLSEGKSNKSQLTGAELEQYLYNLYILCMIQYIKVQLKSRGYGNKEQCYIYSIDNNTLSLAFARKVPVQLALKLVYEATKDFNKYFFENISIDHVNNRVTGATDNWNTGSINVIALRSLKYLDKVGTLKTSKTSNRRLEGCMILSQLKVIERFIKYDT